MADRTPKRRTEDRERALADKYGRIVQVAALVALVGMVTIDQLTPGHIETWLYGSVVGIAVGAKPEDFRRIIGGRK